MLLSIQTICLIWIFFCKLTTSVHTFHINRLVSMKRQSSTTQIERYFKWYDCSWDDLSQLSHNLMRIVILDVWIQRIKRMRKDDIISVAKSKSRIMYPNWERTEFTSEFKIQKTIYVNWPCVFILNVQYTFVCPHAFKSSAQISLQNHAMSIFY